MLKSVTSCVKKWHKNTRPVPEIATVSKNVLRQPSEDVSFISDDEPINVCLTMLAKPSTKHEAKFHLAEMILNILHIGLEIYGFLFSDAFWWFLLFCLPLSFFNLLTSILRLCTVDGWPRRRVTFNGLVFLLLWYIEPIVYVLLPKDTPDSVSYAFAANALVLLALAMIYGRDFIILEKVSKKRNLRTFGNV